VVLKLAGFLPSLISEVILPPFPTKSILDIMETSSNVVLSGIYNKILTKINKDIYIYKNELQNKNFYKKGKKITIHT
jgi:hypothetical protein